MKNYWLTTLIGIVSGIIGAFIYQQFLLPVPLNTPADSLANAAYFTSTAERMALPSRLAEADDFVEASKLSINSVVYIKTISGSEYERYSWFDLFFNNRGTDRRVIGTGSGVIFSEDGYIVTNNHVIDGAEQIEVVWNKRSWLAKLVGTDPSTDLALLKVEAKGLPAVQLGRSKGLQVGDWVLAVGNPFNLSTTVTAGIVSAKGRRINILEDIFPIESFIQTDAAINPGNSGGALVDLTGKLVGINTAILSKTGSYAGYGFAVPVDIVVKVVGDLKNYGEVQKALLGVEVVDIDEAISAKIGSADLDGVAVASVSPDGAGVKADLRAGDVILMINATKIDSKASFDEELSYFAPGDKIKVTYKREGKTDVKEITLTNIDGTTGILRKETYAAKSIGAVLEVVPKLERSRLGITNGIRIRQVGNGLIRQMELSEGDVVVSINNYQITSPQELEEVLVKIRGRVYVEIRDKEGQQKRYSYFF